MVSRMLFCPGYLDRGVPDNSPCSYRVWSAMFLLGHCQKDSAPWALDMLLPWSLCSNTTESNGIGIFVAYSHHWGKPSAFQWY